MTRRRSQLRVSPITNSCPEGNDSRRNLPAKARFNSSGVSSDSSSCARYATETPARDHDLATRSSSKSSETDRDLLSTATTLAVCEDATSTPCGVNKVSAEPSIIHRSNTAKATSGELMLLTLSYHLGFAAAEYLCRGLGIDIGRCRAVLREVAASSQS